MPYYIAIEIGNSAYTEFRMKNGELHETDDRIHLGQVKAEDSAISFSYLADIFLYLLK
ncbi:MAG: hypothetical protein QW771_03615 [Candidatus Micrarchaeia archaeon]